MGQLKARGNEGHFVTIEKIQVQESWEMVTMMNRSPCGGLQVLQELYEFQWMS